VLLEVADREVLFAEIGQDVELAFADIGRDKVARIPEEEEVLLEVYYKEVLANIQGLVLLYSERSAYYSCIKEPCRAPYGISISWLYY
jgi:hypothetical protein